MSNTTHRRNANQGKRGLRRTPPSNRQTAGAKTMAPHNRATLRLHQTTAFPPLLSKGKCFSAPPFPVFAGGYNIVTFASAMGVFEWHKIGYSAAEERKMKNIPCKTTHITDHWPTGMLSPVFWLRRIQAAPFFIVRVHHLRHLSCIGLCALAILLQSCGDRPVQQPPATVDPAATTSRKPGCQGCHPAVRLDPSHDLACTGCHGGNPEGATLEQAHAGLISQPAHPDQMQKACGTCHGQQVSQVAASLHFTARNEINAVRAAFGAQAPLASLTEIPVHASATSPLDLADDLLRRRCLRCHVYNAGDIYPETVRGTGCAACHLLYGNGTMTGHGFVKSPPDSQCLHCHYGNFVGGDYYGRFEHDFNLEYRTPYRTDTAQCRPYGVEFHQLAPDIHQQKGLACIDCHSGAELMGRHGNAPGKEKPLTCLTCHDWRTGMPLPLDNLRVEANRLVLITRLDNKKLLVPQAVHPAHRQYEKKVHCTVCHSQWAFNDQGTHLLRTEHPEHPAWSRLTVQGCREVEEQLDNAAGQGPFQRDKITGVPSPGLWLKGYELRRWESPLIGVGPDGRLQIFRPILDLHLSMTDSANKVIFDNVGVEPARQRYLPYTPHTVGKAGAFFRERLKPNLPIETKP